MNNIHLECFEENWQKFITRLHGQIIIEARKQKLSFSMLKLILADHIGFWDIRQEEGGRWLDEYEAKNPEKGAMVRKILVKDMKFSDEFIKNENTDIVKYAVPVAGAVAGFAISNILGATKIVKAAATVAPAVMSYPLVNNISSSMQKQATKEMIGFYIGQLEKYKKSVESILENS